MFVRTPSQPQLVGARPFRPGVHADTGQRRRVHRRFNFFGFLLVLLFIFLEGENVMLLLYKYIYQYKKKP